MTVSYSFFFSGLRSRGAVCASSHGRNESRTDDTRRYTRRKLKSLMPERSRETSNAQRSRYRRVHVVSILSTGGLAASEKLHRLESQPRALPGHRSRRIVEYGLDDSRESCHAPSAFRETVAGPRHVRFAPGNLRTRPRGKYIGARHADSAGPVPSVTPRVSIVERSYAVMNL